MSEDVKANSAPMLCSRFFSGVEVVFADYGVTLSRSGDTVEIQCGGGDSADKVFRWMENLPEEIRLAREFRDRRRESVNDIPRVESLPIREQLRDRGPAMKIVPFFALAMIAEAAKVIEEQDKMLHRIAMDSFAEDG